MQNVADALYALKFDADAMQAAQAAEQASTRSLAIARKQFALGDANHVAVLQAEIALVQAQVTRYSDTAGLFEALGGGWWHDGNAQAVH